MNNRPQRESSGGKKLLGIAVVIVAGSCATLLGVVNAGAQTKATAATPLKFEVASVRRSAVGVRRVASGKDSWGDVTGRVSLRRASLTSVLLRAYNLQASQISGPTWLDTEVFDILAIAPAGTSKEQIRLMLQSLLEERFRLKFHRLTQTTPVYALVVRGGGARLKESLPDDTSGVPAVNTAKVTGSGNEKSITGTSTGGFGRFRLSVGHGIMRWEFANMTTAALAEFLSQRMFDLPVVDMTGLGGSYQVTLERSLSETASGGFPAELGEAGQPSLTAPEPPGRSLRASLEKLGLGLVRRSASTEKFIIDHMERTPTPN